jgi:hypothetical protein
MPRCLTKQGDGALSNVLEAPQVFVRNLTHLANGFQASGRERVLNPGR